MQRRTSTKQEPQKSGLIGADRLPTRRAAPGQRRRLEYRSRGCRKDGNWELVGRGGELTSPGGLLGDLTKRVLETGPEGEMDGHLGYAKHTVEGRDGGNSRDGTRTKTVITDVGPVDIEVPRDRDGTFDRTVRAADIRCSVRQNRFARHRQRCAPPDVGHMTRPATNGVGFCRHSGSVTAERPPSNARTAQNTRTRVI